MIVKIIFTFVQLWRTLLSDIIFLLCDNYVKDCIKEDVARYNGQSGIPFSNNLLLRMNYLLLTQIPFRSIFYYRVKKRNLSFVNRLFIKPSPNIEIRGEIGPGLHIFHNFGCVIDLETCGRNLTVAQGVTIGLGKSNSEGRQSPIIGDNCWIATNSVVFGPIVNGDNVTIGAGSVVNKDIDSGCTVVGNPARIIHRKSEYSK